MVEDSPSDARDDAPRPLDQSKLLTRLFVVEDGVEAMAFLNHSRKIPLTLRSPT
jgi:hypothetical protein